MGDTIEMAGPIQSGESYPTVTIGGMTMAIKWHMSASYEMSKRGFALADLKSDNPKSICAYMELFSILVAPFFRAQNQVAPDADWWASKLGETNATYLQIITAINESCAKANPSGKTATAAPVTATQPTQVSQ